MTVLVSYRTYLATINSGINDDMHAITRSTFEPRRFSATRWKHASLTGDVTVNYLCLVGAVTSTDHHAKTPPELRLPRYSSQMTAWLPGWAHDITHGMTRLHVAFNNLVYSVSDAHVRLFSIRMHSHPVSNNIVTPLAVNNKRTLQGHPVFLRDSLLHKIFCQTVLCLVSFSCVAGFRLRQRHAAFIWHEERVIIKTLLPKAPATMTLSS